MKAVKLFFFSCLFSTFILAQNNTNLAQEHFSSADTDLGWIKIKKEHHYDGHHFFKNTFKAFGLQDEKSMHLVKEEQDEYGWAHYRFHQYYNQLRVEGGTYILHEKNGRVEKANGKIIPNISLSTAPNFDEDKAIEYALKYHPANHYKWQNQQAEQQLKQVKKNPHASYAPLPELVIVDKDYPRKSGNLRLAYRMIIYADQPLGRHLCWIDAQTGALIQSYNLLHSSGIEGTAVTRYHGEQTIHTSQNTEGLYVLRDTSRGGGITTLDASDEYNIVDFTDSDNFWDNFNENQDEVATDAHFGATATYDFFYDNFGYDSYDGQGAELISNVHFGDNFNNAFWDGTTMTYGDGDGELFGPLTAIDVCGHEVAHGVTEFTAGLVYAFEPGALNESFSDIFGKTIEFLYAPDGASWILGERMIIDSTLIFRSMSNPNDADDPKFYLGEYWFEGTGDSGGVHTNSGVQNFWYYMLVNGFTGTNEAGINVNVPAIGMEKAMRIAFRNLVVYLTEDSHYIDARVGSLEAAADIYGFCSPEYLAVAAAWEAVGIGYRIQDNDYQAEFDIRQMDDCEISEIEISMQLFNNGCMDSLQAGTRIPVSYQVDNDTPVLDTFELPQSLLATEFTAFTFSQKTAITSYGEHIVSISAEIPGDVEPINNTNEYTFINRVYQNEEFAVTEVFSFTGFCDSDPDRGVLARAQYQGCDTLREGATLPYTLAFKSIFIDDEQPNFRDRAPFDNLNVFERIEYNDYGFGNGLITVNYPGDPTPDNNQGSFFIARLLNIQNGSPWDIEPFSNAMLDSTYMAIEPRSYSSNRIQMRNNNAVLYTSGSSILDANNELRVNVQDTPRDFFNANFEFQTRITMCLDLAGMNEPRLSFDLAQQRANVDYSIYGINRDYAAMLGVYINGRLQDTLIYNDINNFSSKNYEYDLSDFTDEAYELEIRALALTLVEINGQFFIGGDYNILDNIRIYDQTVSVNDPELAQQINIFPNPSNGNFNISRRDGKAFDEAAIEIYDAAGRLVGGKSVQSSETSITFGAALVPGIYTVKIVDHKRTLFSKVVKQ